jgi:hypothetical protein
MHVLLEKQIYGSASIYYRADGFRVLPKLSIFSQTPLIFLFQGIKIAGHTMHPAFSSFDPDQQPAQVPGIG